MNTTIWKYRLAVEDRQTLELPEGAEILSVQVQDGAPTLWALVDPTAVNVRELTLLTRGTGHDASGVGRFIGTYQMEGGRFVGHVFEAPGFRTPSGRTLTSADIEALADEAEAGYEISSFTPVSEERREELRRHTRGPS